MDGLYVWLRLTVTALVHLHTTSCLEATTHCSRRSCLPPTRVSCHLSTRVRRHARSWRKWRTTIGVLCLVRSGVTTLSAADLCSGQTPVTPLSVLTTHYYTYSFEFYKNVGSLFSHSAILQRCQIISQCLGNNRSPSVQGAFGRGFFNVCNEIFQKQFINDT